jgi:hypothetical protein
MLLVEHGRLGILPFDAFEHVKPPAVVLACEKILGTRCGLAPAKSKLISI